MFKEFLRDFNFRYILVILNLGIFDGPLLIFLKSFKVLITINQPSSKTDKGTGLEVYLDSRIEDKVTMDV